MGVGWFRQRELLPRLGEVENGLSGEPCTVVMAGWQGSC